MARASAAVGVSRGRTFQSAIGPYSAKARRYRVSRSLAGIIDASLSRESGSVGIGYRFRFQDIPKLDGDAE